MGETDIDPITDLESVSESRFNKLKELLNLLPEKDPLGVSISHLAALLVGMPRKGMASLPRNSLTDERITARPSPDLHSSLGNEK